MADANTAPRGGAAPPTKVDTQPASHLWPGRTDPAAAGYEVDYYRWSYTQADLLRQGRYGELDLPNLIEELESLGKSDKRALASAYRVLIMHLLKMQFQPDRRTSSWLATVREQRRAIESIEDDSRSLRGMASEIMSTAYPKARADAARETRLPPTTFPAECPYSLDFLRDHDKLSE